MATDPAELIARARNYGNAIPDEYGDVPVPRDAVLGLADALEAHVRVAEAARRFDKLFDASSVDWGTVAAGWLLVHEALDLLGGTDG